MATIAPLARAARRSMAFARAAETQLAVLRTLCSSTTAALRFIVRRVLEGLGAGDTRPALTLLALIDIPKPKAHHWIGLRKVLDQPGWRNIDDGGLLHWLASAVWAESKRELNRQKALQQNVVRQPRESRLRPRERPWCVSCWTEDVVFTKKWTCPHCGVALDLHWRKPGSHDAMLRRFGLGGPILVDDDNHDWATTGLRTAAPTTSSSRGLGPGSGDTLSAEMSTNDDVERLGDAHAGRDIDDPDPAEAKRLDLLDRLPPAAQAEVVRLQLREGYTLTDALIEVRRLLPALRGLDSKTTQRVIGEMKGQGKHDHIGLRPLGDLLAKVETEKQQKQDDRAEIVALMAANKVSGRELARRIGVSTTAVSVWLKSTKSIPATRVAEMKAAIWLGC